METLSSREYCFFAEIIPIGIPTKVQPEYLQLQGLPCSADAVPGPKQEYCFCRKHQDYREANRACSENTVRKSDHSIPIPHVSLPMLQRCLIPQDNSCRVTWSQVQNKEHDKCDTKDNRNQHKQALEDVFVHIVLPPVPLYD